MGNWPRLGAVGDVAIAEDEHRCHVADGDLPGVLNDVEAIAGTLCSQHRHRAFAVAAANGLQQVGLFGFGRQAGARPAALHVHDDQRQLSHHRQPDPFLLSAMPGPLEVVTASDPPNAAPMAEVIAAISSSAWNVRTPKFL